MGPASDRLFAGSPPIDSLMRSQCWANMRLGAVETWPSSLRTAVGLCLSAPCPMAIWWGEDFILIYNEAYRALLGFRHSQAWGRSGPEAWPEGWSQVETSLKRVFETAQILDSVPLRLSIQQQDRLEETDFTCTYSPIFMEAGTIGGVFSTLVTTPNPSLREPPEDRTGRQIEAELHASEARYRLLAEAMPHLVWTLAPNGRVEYMNPRWQEMIGIPIEQLNRTGWHLIVHPDDFPKIMAAWTALGEQTDWVEAEARLRDVQGRYRWYLHRSTAIRDEQGRLLRCIGTSTDIDDRKRAEAALRESEERLRLALDAGQAGVWDWDIINDHVTWSERIYGFHGLPPATFGRPMADFAALVHPGDRERVSASIQAAIAEHTPYQIEFRVVQPQGETRWLFTNGQILYDEAGTPIRMLGASLDITERKQAEAEREQLLERERTARESAEAANRLKDEFLAVLSHELRTPLNPILGWSKLLQTRQFDEQSMKCALETIERNARLQAQLIEDLLDVSRVLQGKLTLNAVPVDLVSTIEAAKETVRLAAEAKSIQIQTQLQAQDRSVLGDPNRLQQVIWNLLSNAVKFTPEGGRVAVRLERVGGDEGDREVLLASPVSPSPSYAQITVTDTGRGISPDFLPHVFETFRQEDGTTTRKFGGLGLGLAVVRRIVELHGGTVMVESPGEGLGTTFAIRLPLLTSSRA